jgi:hypothetical protein
MPMRCGTFSRRVRYFDSRGGPAFQFDVGQVVSKNSFAAPGGPLDIQKLNEESAGASQ